MSTLTLVTQSLLQSWLQTDPEPRHAGETLVETLVDAIRHALPASYKFAGKQMAAELATERRANPDLADAISAAMLKIKADGRLGKIQKKWFGDSFDTPDSVPNPAL